jgi:hypothetical protein
MTLSFKLFTQNALPKSLKITKGLQEWVFSAGVESAPCDELCAQLLPLPENCPNLLENLREVSFANLLDNFVHSVGVGLAVVTACERDIHRHKDITAG